MKSRKELSLGIEVMEFQADRALREAAGKGLMIVGEGGCEDFLPRLVDVENPLPVAGLRKTVVKLTRVNGLGLDNHSALAVDVPALAANYNAVEVLILR